MKVRDSEVLEWVWGQRKMGAFGCWISPSYCAFSLGMRFETYDPFIIFQFFFAGLL
jgi:hypothetical protein